MNDARRELLRHTLSTVAYRGGKAIRDTPSTFGDFKIGDASRTPAQILAHIGDLFDWALSIAKGQQKWNNSQPLPWEQEVERFFATLKAFDDFLASGAALQESPEKLFQGPVADSLTHIGQIAMLRRLAGVPMRGENYFVAQMASGQVGRQQPAPKREFD